MPTRGPTPALSPGPGKASTRADWMAKYERVIVDRLDRMEDHLTERQRHGDDNDT